MFLPTLPHNTACFTSANRPVPRFLKFILAGWFLLFLAGSSYAQTLEWALSMGGTPSEEGRDIVVDAQGNVYIVGLFYHTVDLDPGPGVVNLTSLGNADMYIEKLDANGNFLWVKQIGGVGLDVASGVTLDPSGNVLMMGGFSGTVDFDPSPSVQNLISAGLNDIFMLKLDPNGNYIWAKQLGAGAWFMQTNSKGEIYTGGALQGTRDVDPGPGVLNLTSLGSNDMVVQKLDSSGNLIWAKRMGGTLGDYILDMDFDAQENPIFCGHFYGTTDLDPGPGFVNYTSAGRADIFVLKLDTAGNYLWSNVLGAAEADLSRGIEIDAQGDIYFTGEFATTVDFDPGPGVHNLVSPHSFWQDAFISKLDSLGNFIWAKGFGGLGQEYSQELILDAQGNVISSGYYQDTADFDPGPSVYSATAVGGLDPFLWQLDPQGEFLDLITMEGTGTTEFISGLTQDQFGYIYTVGWFQDTLDLDPGPGVQLHTSVGANNIFVQKIRPCPPSITPQTLTACDSITWQDGITYTASTNGPRVYLPNSNLAGCDSIIQLDLTINLSSAQTDSISACGSYTWLNGNTYTASTNTPSLIYTNSVGCDSVLTLDLTILNPTDSTDEVHACEPYTWIDGNTYTRSDSSAQVTLANAAGCDSIVYLALTIDSVNTQVNTGPSSLTALAVNATFQWLDCAQGSAPIPGATQSTFTPPSTGNYAVEITQNGCIDTSACIALTLNALTSNLGTETLHLYPNPTQGLLRVEALAPIAFCEVEITNVWGASLAHFQFQQVQSFELILDQSPGIYFLTLLTPKGHQVHKVVKY